MGSTTRRTPHTPLLNSISVTTIRKLLSFLEKYQIHEKTKKKVFPSKSNRNLHLLLQVETVEIFLSMCYWNTSIRYGHLSICFQSKKSKAKKKWTFLFLVLCKNQKA